MKILTIGFTALAILGCGVFLKNDKKDQDKNTVVQPAPGTPSPGEPKPSPVPKEEIAEYPTEPESFIRCSGGRRASSQCAVVRTEIATPEDIDATYSVTYESTCFSGGETSPTNITIEGDLGGFPITNGLKETLVIRSAKGLKLKDHDPVSTRADFFDDKPQCKLLIHYKVTPSDLQLNLWTKTVRELEIKLKEELGATGVTAKTKSELKLLESAFEKWHKEDLLKALKEITQEAGL